MNQDTRPARASAASGAGDRASQQLRLLAQPRQRQHVGGRRGPSGARLSARARAGIELQRAGRARTAGSRGLGRG
eukprot:1600665-Pyramimonas_sp.AAC.1